MELVTRYCHTCPDWYDLPDQGVPDLLWFWGRGVPGEPPDLPTQDLRGRATIMDQGHDYRIEGKRFRYMYSGGEECWVIFQYGRELSVVPCTSCGVPVPVNANFCGMCGSPQEKP